MMDATVLETVWAATVSRLHLGDPGHMGIRALPESQAAPVPTALFSGTSDNPFSPGIRGRDPGLTRIECTGPQALGLAYS